MLNTDKRLVQYAKKLVQISIEDGRVSDERVKAIMATFASRPPRRFKTILKLYLYYRHGKSFFFQPTFSFLFPKKPSEIFAQR